MKDLQTTIQNHPFFEGMNPEHLELLAACATKVSARPGQYLMKERANADKFYLIVSGEVQLEIFMLQPGPIQVQTLVAGDALGWSWLIPPYKWRFDAKPLCPSELIAFDAEQLRALLRQEHDLGYDLLMKFVVVMEKRLHATREQLLGAFAVQ